MLVLKRNLFAHSSGGSKSKIKVLTGLVAYGGSEGESAPCFSLAGVAGNPWHSLACRHITSSSHGLLPVCLGLPVPLIWDTDVVTPPLRSVLQVMVQFFLFGTQSCQLHPKNSLLLFQVVT